MDFRASSLIKRLAALTFLVGLFAVASGDAVSLSQAPPISGEHVPGEIVVIERPGTQPRGLTTAVGGAREIQHIPSLRLHRLKLPPQASLEDALRRYAALPWVQAAEPNYIIRSAVTPNDPLYGSQSWYYSLLEAPAAWDIEAGEPALLVAVVDTGLDLSHPDLDANLWANPAEPVNGIDDDGNSIVDDHNGAAFISAPSRGCTDPQPPNNPDDDSGHGTAVAGIVGAETNSLTPQGVAGTAWRVTLMPLKVLDCMAAGTSVDAATAIDYAASHGARVVNLSIVIPVRDGSGTCLQSQPPAALATAIQQAQASRGLANVEPAPVIFDDDIDFSSRHAPADFVQIQAHAIESRLAVRGERTAERQEDPDLDGGFRARRRLRNGRIQSRP